MLYLYIERCSYGYPKHDYISYDSRRPMAKTKKNQIDEDEKKLVSELLKNSKQNIGVIAKNCGFSKQKAWRLIKDLEAKQVIWGYTAVVDEVKLGKKYFFLMIKRTLKRLDEKTVEQIVSTKTEELAREFGVTIESSTFVHGAYDWILTFTADDILRVRKFQDALYTLFPGRTRDIAVAQSLLFIRKNHILNPERKKLKEFL